MRGTVALRRLELAQHHRYLGAIDASTLRTLQG